MKCSRILVLAASAVALYGCNSSGSASPSPATNPSADVGKTSPPPPTPTPTSSDPVVARVNGEPLTMSQLEKPLLEGYGLNMLLNMVQVEYAKQEAARAGVTVTDDDIKNEHDQTVAKLFQDADKSEYDQLFKQFLEQQHVSAAEFNLVMQTNAYLRKIAEPMVKGKITDESLQEAFRELYGETVQIRLIQLANMQEVLEAKRRLAGGEPFEQVAHEMSRNARTAELGGEIPPFSRSANYPQALKDAAFSLKEGEVSDAVESDGAYYLIKLEKRIPPKAVKFEDEKESLRKDLQDRLVQATMKQLRAQIAQDSIKGLVIENPILRQQYSDKLTQRDQQITDHNKIREEYEKERQRILERAATQPATQPATAPASEVARPPATQGESAR